MKVPKKLVKFNVPLKAIRKIALICLTCPRGPANLAVICPPAGHIGFTLRHRLGPLPTLPSQAFFSVESLKKGCPPPFPTWLDD
jgi:hypothetical protein